MLKCGVMQKTPAPLEEVQQKLRSPTAAVRAVALIHAQAHGAEGRSLAVDVARLLEDEDPGIQLRAVHSFRAIGRGAKDAVPLLLRLLTRADGSPQVRARGAFLLGVVGPAAAEAIPELKA